MAIEFKAPQNTSAARLNSIRPNIGVFLAGSIEMGKADNWQVRLSDSLLSEYPKDDVLIYNPRRDDWDSSWVQDMENDQFRTQVEWELSHLDAANIVVFYFDPTTLSLISLLELGVRLGRKPISNQKVIVYCPKEYTRSGNVYITSLWYGGKLVSSIDELISEVKNEINLWKERVNQK
jgi:hypothetical protein